MSTAVWIVVIGVTLLLGVFLGYWACKFDTEWQRLREVDRRSRS